MNPLHGETKQQTSDAFWCHHQPGHGRGSNIISTATLHVLCVRMLAWHAVRRLEMQNSNLLSAHARVWMACFPENGFANDASGCGTIPSGPGPSLIRPISCPPPPRHDDTMRTGYTTPQTPSTFSEVCLCWKRRNEGGWKTLGFVRNSRLSTEGRGQMRIRSTNKERTGHRTKFLRATCSEFRRVPLMPGDRDPGACRQTVRPRWPSHIHNIAINGPNMTESHAVKQRL